MNYQTLIYFKIVAEQCHFTRAANLLYITQPALSKAIRNLEHELGAPLFEKDGRNVSLTPYGKMFYEYVKRSVDEVEKGIAAVRHMVDVENDTVCISALFSMYAIFLPEEIMRFRRIAPTCKFSLQYHYTTSILQDVLHERAELGLCSNFEPINEYVSLKKYTLYEEPVGLIVAKNHPFAKREKVSIPELKNERFIVYIRSRRGTNGLLYDLCAPYGFEPNIVMEAYNDYGVVGMVAAGEGIAIIPTSGFLNINSVVPVELDINKRFVRDINVVWRGDKKLPPMTRCFLDMLIEDSKSGTLSTKQSDSIGQKIL